MDEIFTELKGKEAIIYYDEASYKDEGSLEAVSDHWVMLKRTTLKGEESLFIPIRAIRMMKVSGD